MVAKRGWLFFFRSRFFYTQKKKNMKSPEMKILGFGKGNFGNPQFPGMQNGNSIEQVRDLIKHQKKIRGYRFTLSTTESEFKLNLPGDASILLGLNVLLDVSTPPADRVVSMKLIVNNEIVIESVNPRALSPEFCEDEYYFIPRPLSGTDDLTVKFAGANVAQYIDVTVYYI